MLSVSMEPFYLTPHRKVLLVDARKISVVLLTRNEEVNIEACLSTCDFADEIILVDDGSTDRTIDIAAKFGDRVKVFHHAMNGDWAQQQNFGIDQAKNYWVFLLDADERVTQDLSKKLANLASQEDKAFLVQRHNRFKHISATHGILRPDWVKRFAPKTKIRVYGQVHPEIRVSCPEEKIHGEGLIHYPYRSWKQYFNKFNNYTGLSADKYLEQGKHVSFVKDIMLRPVWAFLKVYFINGGFLDGRAGFIFSMNHAFYTMNKYVKYYFLKNYSGEL